MQQKDGLALAGDFPHQDDIADPEEPIRPSPLPEVVTSAQLSVGAVPRYAAVGKNEVEQTQ